MAHFMPLAKLPSAKETGELVFQHISMVSPLMWSQTRGLSLPLYSGGNSATILGPPSVCCPGSTPSPTAKPKERRWRLLYTVSSLACTHQPGPSIYCQSNTLTTSWPALRPIPVCLRVTATAVFCSPEGGFLPSSWPVCYSHQPVTYQGARLSSDPCKYIQPSTSPESSQSRRVH